MASVNIGVHGNQSPSLVSRDGLRLREDTVYTDYKGREEKGLRERVGKALDQLEEALTKVLGQEEAVFYIARGGWSTAVFEYFVFTNRRLLHFLIKRDSTLEKSLCSVGWGDLVEAMAKGWIRDYATLRLKYHDGKREKHHLRVDSRKIKALLDILLPSSVGEATSAKGMIYCATCMAALTPGASHCGQCGRDTSLPKAWSPGAIAWISFFCTFFPAGIMHAINFKRLGHPVKKRSRLVAVIVGFIAFVALALLTPGDEGTKELFAALNAFIAWFFYQDQMAMFRQHLSRGGKKAGISVPLILSILWLVIFIIFLGIIGGILKSNASGG